MKIAEAKERGYKRGFEAAMRVKSVPNADRKTVRCTCKKDEMCDRCLTFAAFTKEELRRKNSKTEWHRVLDELKDSTNFERLRDVFEDAVTEGVLAGVEHRLANVPEQEIIDA